LAARGVVGTILAYAATKGAIDTPVKHFASLLDARGIRVNAVAPGVVETDGSKRAASLRSACRGLIALRSLTISVASSPSWLPKMPGGSLAIPSMWTTAQSCELWRHLAIATLVSGNLLVGQALSLIPR
jgi:NAD(P)-dependent dehydrogenase (short-subunit alcohol dehydrogenase family)